MKEAINAVEDKFGLPNGWVNADFKKTACPTGKSESESGRLQPTARIDIKDYCSKTTRKIGRPSDIEYSLTTLTFCNFSTSFLLFITSHFKVPFFVSDKL